MAQRSGRAATAAAAAKSRARKVVGPKAIGRIGKSLDAAELGLKDLRKELGRGGSTIVKDLERTIKDSRKNLASVNRSVLRDLEKLQNAATKGTPPKPASRKASASSKTTKRTTGSARKASGTTRASTARKSSGTTRASTARKSSGTTRASTAKKSSGATTRRSSSGGGRKGRAS